MAGCRPTGWAVTDRLGTALFAGLVALATSRARRWSWLVLGGAAALTAVAADDNLAKALGVWALVLAFGSVAADQRDQAIGALTGGLAIEALLRIRGFGAAGVPSVITLAAVVPVMVSGYRLSPSADRRTVRRSLVIGAAVGVVLLVPMTIGALIARPRIERGIADVNAGFDAAKRGDKPGAAALFRKAEDEFGSAHTWVGSWWTQPARIVPWAGLQAEVLDVATREGDQLAKAASKVADTEQDPLSIQAGTVSIESVQALAEPLAEAASTLEASSHRLDDVDSSWLLPPLADRLDRFADEVARALPAARNAAAAVRVAPEMLGRDAPRHYFVAFTTPAETRGLGGFIGSWALLTIDRGHIELTRTGRVGELNPVGGPPQQLDGPERYLAAYGQDYNPQKFFQNVTASPDFHDVGEVMAQLVPQTPLGTTIDGAFVMDPVSLAAMLQLTGPISVPGLDQQLTADNAAKILLFDQYALFPDRGGDDPGSQPGTREGFLATVGKATFNAFLSNQIPGPQQLVDALGPMTEQRRLLAYSPNPAEEALFAQLGMDGAFPDWHASDGGDFLSLVTTNRGGNKLDAYLHRNVTYAVTVDPTNGSVRGTATVVLRNAAPASGLPFEVGFNNDDLPIGTNQTLLTLYTPALVDQVSVDGQPTVVGGHKEFGLDAYTIGADVAPGGSVTVVFTFHGQIRPEATYRLHIAAQPLVHADEIAVKVTGSNGWNVTKGTGVDVAGGTATVAPDGQHSTDVHVDLDSG